MCSLLINPMVIMLEVMAEEIAAKTADAAKAEATIEALADRVMATTEVR